MRQVSILHKLAAVNEGTIAATRHDMLLFSFPTEANAKRFADTTGGMLIRGLVRGAVDVAVIPQEVK